MGKEIRIKFDEIRDPRKVTGAVREAMAQAMGDKNELHRYEVDRMEDDEKRGERIITMQPKRTFVGFGKCG